MTRLKFADGEKVDVKVLGSLEVEGKRYAYLFDEEKRHIYIYRYKQKKKDKYALIEITDQEEFQKACNAFDKKVGVKK